MWQSKVGKKTLFFILNGLYTSFEDVYGNDDCMDWFCLFIGYLNKLNDTNADLYVWLNILFSNGHLCILLWRLIYPMFYSATNEASGICTSIYGSINNL